MVALFDRRDRFHSRFRDLVLAHDVPLQLHTTWPCITEASHLLNARYRLALLRWIGQGAVRVFPFDGQDLLVMCENMERYTQEPRIEMDLADASLYWLACESGLTKILTLDVRGFQRYRLPDGRPFEIL